MDADELVKRYAAGKREFVWANLPSVNLANQHLDGINLSRANLSAANLERISLKQACLTKANLQNANLRNANLQGANLRKADLTGAILENTQIEEADLQGAIMPDGSIYETLEFKQDSPEAAAISTPSPSQANPIAPPSSPVPFSPPVLPSPQRPAPSKNLWEVVPWPSLLLFGVGYGFYGLLMGVLQGEAIGWPLVLFSAILWAVDEAYSGFIPILAAIVTVVSIERNIEVFYVPAAVSTALFISLRFIGWDWYKAVRDSLWIGGIGVILMTIATWFFRGEYEKTIGVVVSGKSVFAIFLLLGMAGSALGMVAWMQMNRDGFKTKSILWIMLGVAALGLFIGSVVGFRFASTS
ncbi:MAG: pentapeptide repeat-containing protein [Leptolyngbyaceae cyanobacterium bins.59]|nr:pentapeptide repeat-containing protein [Leptolyngbyaceae cyanobacterium bins.59]